MEIIDVHCHMLPDVDDGASDKGEARKMLARQRQDGVVGIIVTPHYRIGFLTPDKQKVENQYHWLYHMARPYNIKIWLGCECYACDNMIEGFENNTYATMAGSSYVLIEFSERHSRSMVMQYTAKVINAGYIPVIAHAERIQCIYRNSNYLEELIHLGAKIQVNANSIVRNRPFGMKRQMKKWMMADYISFIASDCHNMKDRKPNLGKCYRSISRKMGKEYARRIFYENPQQIIIQGGNKNE